MNLAETIIQANKALDRHELDIARGLVFEVESALGSIEDDARRHSICVSLAGVMIELGSWTHDETLIERGINYSEEAILGKLPMISLVPVHYNLGNGYLALWDMRRSRCFNHGAIDDSYTKAKTYFRLALELADHDLPSIPLPLYKNLLVNYGNCLDSIGRSVEAATQYDEAIALDGTMSEALGNKAITLHSLAFLSKGYTHIFLLESHRLLSEALKRNLPESMEKPFRMHFDQLQANIDEHETGMHAETIALPEVQSQFERFLRDFCVRHHLYLTPTTFVGRERTTVYGDPMFFSTMFAPLDDRVKFDRYTAYMNEVKQDYVLARYLLVQSQYQTKYIDTIDRDVTLYYPLDYSLNSSYIQMMKTALRLSIDLLDKIAYFVWDYCHVQSIGKDKVNFRNLWTNNAPSVLRGEFTKYENRFLFALFDLSLDLAKDGHQAQLYEHRNILTHRFLVVHDTVVRSQRNDEIPRIYFTDLFRDCVEALQVARSAVIYLILFIEIEERKLEGIGPHGKIAGVPLDEVFRWTPSHGEREE